MCQWGLFKCQGVYGLYRFAWTEQVRPLQASYLKTGSLAEVRPLQASLVISLCALLGWCFLIRSVCGCQYEPLKGQGIYGLYSFAWAEQMRPLQESYLKTGSPAEVRPLQASLIISLCVLLGRSFLVRSSLWVSILAPKGSVVYGLFSFARKEHARPRHTSYFQTGSLGEVRPLKAPFTIRLCTMLGWCFLIKSHPYVSAGSL